MDQRDCSAEPALACRIVVGKWEDPRREKYPKVEVAITNVSDNPVTIDCRNHVLEFLEVVVTDYTGKRVSEPGYGRTFPPCDQVYSLRLMPGETYTHRIGYLTTVPTEHRVAGTYTVQAAYTYRDITAVSPPVKIEYRAR